MRTITITLSDDLETELELFLRLQEGSPDLDDVVADALREFLSLRRRYGDIEFRMPRRQPLVITPVDLPGSPTDVSINHDAYLAEDELSSWQRNEPGNDPSPT